MEAIAVLSLILFAENLQITLKAAVKEDADWYNRFMPLTEVVNFYVLSHSILFLLSCCCVYS